jgi:hypothetical protein
VESKSNVNAPTSCAGHPHRTYERRCQRLTVDNWTTRHRTQLDETIGIKGEALCG